MNYTEVYDENGFEIGYDTDDSCFVIEHCGNYDGGPYRDYVDLEEVKRWVATAEKLEAETHPPTGQGMPASQE